MSFSIVFWCWGIAFVGALLYLTMRDLRGRRE